MFASKDTLLTRPSGYNIARSVRLRSSASAYFNRTSGTPTSGSIFTHSFWVKRGTLGVGTALISGARPTNFDRIYIQSNDTLLYQWNDGTSNLAYVETTQVFRDPSAWYHIVIATDTTQATASNRVKIYINGVQVTALTSTTYPSQNSTSYFNTNAVTLNIGRSTNATFYLDGYLTEINFIDGQALTPSSFGETDSITGVWKPKAYSGTYGTNGFELNFSDNSSNTATTIGKDYSGNGNNWTPNNISVTSGVTYDSMVDSPTVGATSSNYCVWSPIDKGSVTVTNGNLSAVATADVAALRGTMGLPQSGKWYWETTLSAQGYGTGLGIADNACPISNFNAGSTQSRTFQWGSFSGGVTLYGTNQSVLSGTSWAGASQVAANDVVMIAVDMDNGSMWVGKNGTWFNSSGTANPATNTDPRWTGLTGTTWFPVYASYGTGSPPTANANFGQRPFAHTPPTGFVALNTCNLPASTIKNGAAYMAATVYSGNSPSSQTVSNAVNSVSFQPDLVWQKSRTQTYSNVLYDSVRGVQKRLSSNETAAESTASTAVTAFTSSGFTTGADGEMNDPTGGSNNHVAWMWKAGTTSASNTNGSITSTVSAGATQGFSVVTFSGASAGTVGHGLGVAPKMIFIKTRTTVLGWYVYTETIGANGWLQLNTSAAAVTGNPAAFGGTAPTSTVFSYGSGLAGTGNYVAYCFSAVAGYSAFGSYTGNGSADGPFVYTGFRPRFIMIKGSSDADRAWVMLDTSRNTANVMNLNLYANASDAEATDTRADGLSNGFKIRGTGTWVNNSSSTYIYACFAENPFKYSLAR